MSPGAVEPQAAELPAVAPPQTPVAVPAPKAAIERGDRLPNFVLADQDGAFRGFYERARGNPMALLVLSKGAIETEAPLLIASLSRPGPILDLLVVAPDDPASLKTLAAGTPLARLLLSDIKGSIISGLSRACELSPAPGLWLLLDANQRLLETRVGSGLAAWAMDRLAALAPQAQPQVLDQAAPVLLVPNVLDPAACRALIERWRRLGHEEGSVNSIVDGEEVNRIYHGMKKRRDHAIQDEALLKTLVSVIGRRIAPELDKAFGFNRFRFDRFIITCYDAERGDYFRRHRDNASPSTADRRFALTLNLNSEEHEGGELTFPEYGPHRYRPGTGGAVLFSCSLLHEALPVTRGQRFTLLSFLRNPDPAVAGPVR